MALHMQQSGNNVLALPTVSRDHTVHVVKRLKAVVDSRVDQLMDGLAANVSDALFEEMLELDEQDAITRHFNIMRSLKKGSANLSSEFRALMNVAWVQLINGTDRQALPALPAHQQAMLSSYSNRNQSQHKLLIEEIRLRFCQLIGEDMSHHPLLASNLYLCFWFASEKLDLTDEERCLLLPLFSRFVMDRFGQMLAAVNRTLIELHVHKFAVDE